MDIKSLVELYLEEQVRVAGSFPIAGTACFCGLVIGVYDRCDTIYIAANGGTAGLCSNLETDLTFHPFVSDDKAQLVLTRVPRMKVVNLASSPATLTGAMNDFGRDHIFSQQLEGRIKRGDLFIAVSGSGNSANILEAIRVAQSVGAHAVAITRGAGGKCRELADLAIVIHGSSTFPGQTGKNENNFHFEDAFCAISHMVVGILQKHVREKYGIA